MSLARRFDQKGKTIILSETTDEPMTLVGQMSGICWGADTSNNEKNFKRGLECLRNNHGRTLEFPQIYIVLDGWSARVIREFYTHIAGGPTRLQASTRYIDYKNFKYLSPKSIENNYDAKDAYDGTMEEIAMSLDYLTNNCGISKEDAANLLPLGMETKIVVRTNLRHLIDMSRVRLCNRAYWEFRELFKSIMEALSIYSDEWKYLIEEEKIFAPKCEVMGYCNEKYSCGRAMKKEEFDNWIDFIKVCKKANMTPEDLVPNWGDNLETKEK